MAKKKKISAQQFVLDCINKEFELCETGIFFHTFEELKDYAEEHPRWYDEFSFPSSDSVEEFKAYFLEHIYDFKPKRTSKREILNSYNWFYLEYGFPCKEP